MERNQILSFNYFIEQNIQASMAIFHGICIFSDVTNGLSSRYVTLRLCMFYLLDDLVGDGLEMLIAYTIQKIHHQAPSSHNYIALLLQIYRCVNNTLNSFPKFQLRWNKMKLCTLIHCSGPCHLRLFDFSYEWCQSQINLATTSCSRILPG